MAVNLYIEAQPHGVVVTNEVVMRDKCVTSGEIVIEVRRGEIVIEVRTCEDRHRSEDL